MPNCPDCYFKKWIKTDKIDADSKLPIWKCGRCGREIPGDRPFERQKPKVLYLDIETSLTETRNFGLKVPSGFLSYKMVKRPFFIICWAAAWADKPSRIHSECITQEEALAGTDKNILAPLWELMNRADVIAGHNSNKFDIPRITGRFLINGFPKLEAYSKQDTKVMAKKLGLESMSLDYLCELFGFPKKEDMPIEDWIDISETGSPEKLKKMHRYCVGDVKKRGLPVYNMLANYQDWPQDFGMRRFPTDPKNTLDQIENDLIDLTEKL
jgi:DNA polymerase elongation subunit (family B)